MVVVVVVVVVVMMMIDDDKNKNDGDKEQINDDGKNKTSKNNNQWMTLLLALLQRERQQRACMSTTAIVPFTHWVTKRSPSEYVYLQEHHASLHCAKVAAPSKFARKGYTPPPPLHSHARAVHSIVLELAGVHVSLQRVRVAPVATDAVVAPFALIRVSDGIHVLQKMQLSEAAQPNIQSPNPQVYLAVPLPVVVHPRARVHVAVSPRLCALPVPLAALQFAREDWAILVNAMERAVLQSLRRLQQRRRWRVVAGRVGAAHERAWEDGGNGKPGGASLLKQRARSGKTGSRVQDSSTVMTWIVPVAPNALKQKPSSEGCAHVLFER